MKRNLGILKLNKPVQQAAVRSPCSINTLLTELLIPKGRPQQDKIRNSGTLRQSRRNSKET
jgi:hypothetical protein